MFVRSATKGDEESLLDIIAEENLDESGFRSREYLVVCDEEDRDIQGFARLRQNSTESGGSWFEMTSVYVEELPDDAEVRLMNEIAENLEEKGLSNLYFFTSNPEFAEHFGFDELSENQVSDILEERREEKESIVEEDLQTYRLRVGEYQSPEKGAETDVESEKEAQGFDRDYSTKYET